MQLNKSQIHVFEFQTLLSGINNRFRRLSDQSVPIYPSLEEMKFLWEGEETEWSSDAWGTLGMCLHSAIPHDSIGEGRLVKWLQEWVFIVPSFLGICDEVVRLTDFPV